MVNGILLKRIIVLTDLRGELQNLIHTSSLRHSKEDCLAKSSLLSHQKLKCSTCLNIRKQQPAQPIPEIPWTKYDTQLFQLYKKKTLWYRCWLYQHIFLDNYISQSPHYYHASKFSISQIVIGENCSEFKTNELKIFAKDWRFKNDTSSALYPQWPCGNTMSKPSNVLRRRKWKATNTHTILALRTIQLNVVPSPATQPMDRNLRTTLPHIKHYHRYKQKTSIN